MSTARQIMHPYEDYLRIEDASEVRHEYFGGEIYAMAGGTPEHAALAARILVLLGGQLRGCTALTSDLRVHVVETGLTTYPDVSFVCGPVARAAIDRLAITNPTVLIEVTSASTEAYDRGQKLEHYQTIASLRAVVFVSHRESRLTVVERAGEAWRTTDFVAGAELTLASMNVRFQVDDVYEVLNQL